MLLNRTISRTPENDPGLDQAQLFAEGLDYVRKLSGRRWTDHNTHDPGITILELLCYALTELSYRAQFPLQDMLAIPAGSDDNLAKQFFTAQQILPNRALTTSDYRKLIIDLPGVKNAWISPAPLRYFADTLKAQLRATDPHSVGVRPVNVRGLYRVWIEFMDNAITDEVKSSVRVLLNENRNLCEDFVDVEGVEPEWFSLCAEIELEPNADPALVEAQVRFEVERYLTPPVYNYTLSEMLQKRHEDGSPYTVQEIFEGPQLEHGFIDTAELERSDLRPEIRLSDIISVIMDIDGVRAIRDIVVNALDANKKPIVPDNKWRLPVSEGRQPRLSDPSVHGRILFYKRNMPVSSDRDQVANHLKSFNDSLRIRLERAGREDLPIPTGRFRDVANYYSFQNHFPAVYGLSDLGLPNNVDSRRRAQALQLKAYLLFYDQIMANFLGQLSNVGELFSREPAKSATYFSQVVRSFRDYQQIYEEGVNDDQLSALLEEPTAALERRSRFFNHLLARVAEDFHHYVSIIRSTFGGSIESEIAKKSEFLKHYPKEGGERGLAYNYSLTAPEDLWDSDNISGLERRLARLLDIPDASRRNLAPDAASPEPVVSSEGMYLIENILLRPLAEGDPFLPICVDPNCTDCLDDDPYSYRLHIVLPAYAGRFQNMDFRRFVEETIRLEMPAHLLPKICWVNAEDMAEIEKAYRDWVPVLAGTTSDLRKEKLDALVKALFKAKNVYSKQKLHDCGAGDDKPPFILGRTPLGSGD